MIIKLWNHYYRDEIIKKSFDSLLQKHQERWKNGKTCIYFDIVDLLHYKSYTRSLVRDGSFIDSPKWIKSKKATTNPENNDDKCFKYVVTIALNHHKIKYDPEKT